MKKFSIFLIALFIRSVVMAQSTQPCSTCLPYGITFSAQAQIDAFQFNYPECTEILGNVYIYDNSDTVQDNITNLNGLGILTSIGGNFKVWGNPALTSLTGLENLDYVGGDLQIGHLLNPNPILDNLMGLEGLTIVGGTLFIYNNPSLINLTGLENLDTIGGQLRILRNDSLTDLTGLTNLTTIGHELIIGLDVFGNHALTSLTGLENLTSIGGDLFIEDNSSLTSLMGLNNLNNISGQIFIIGNEVLTSLNGLDHLDENTISHLTVNWNISLSDCAIQSICEYLLSLNGSAYFIGNAAGCNSEAEVEAACGVGVEESLVFSLQSSVIIYPNPSSTTITIELPETSSEFQISIFNLQGRESISQKSTSPQTGIDISTLPGGVYFVRITTDRTVMVGKFVKRPE